MLDIEERDEVVHIRVKGRLTRRDYDAIEPMIVAAAERDGRARVLVELRDLNWIEPGAFWADIRFAFKHLSDISRTAFVGDQRWLEWAARLSRPFTRGLVEHFDEAELDDAWNWVMRDV